MARIATLIAVLASGCGRSGYDSLGRDRDGGGDGVADGGGGSGDAGAGIDGGPDAATCTNPMMLASVSTVDMGGFGVELNELAFTLSADGAFQEFGLEDGVADGEVGVTDFTTANEPNFASAAAALSMSSSPIVDLGVFLVSSGGGQQVNGSLDTAVTGATITRVRRTINSVSIDNPAGTTDYSVDLSWEVHGCP